MWYRFEEGNPFGIPRVTKYQVCWYDMDMDGSCFDESFYATDDIDCVLPYVETIEDKDSRDRSRVFVHFDNGDMYELKLEKISEDRKRSSFFNDNYDMEYDAGECEDNFNLYENDDMKFIWGVKSWDDLCDSDACLYTMNDIDLIYLKKDNKYILSLETVFMFDKEERKLSYLERCLDAFTKFMVEHGYNINAKPHWWDVFSDGMNAHFDSIEECYAMFKLLVNGYCS